MSNVDWNSIADQKSGNRKSEDLVFLNSKNLPQTFLPSPDIEKYTSVYDETTKKNRPPSGSDDDEKVRTQYLFYGLFFDKGQKSIKICCCGQQVAKGIGTVQKSLSNLGLISFVKVSSTGSGLGTEYSVEAVKVGDKNITPDVWNRLEDEVKKLPALDEMRDRLLGLKSDSNEAPDIGAVSAMNKADILDI